MMKQKRVLVLNKSWQPVRVVSLERAFSLLLTEYKNGKPKAEILDPVNGFITYTWEDWSGLKPKDDEEVIRTSKFIFRIPEIIILSKYNKTPQHKVHFSRRSLYKRDNYQCMYCGDTPGSELLTVDHVIPRSKGGLTTWENTCLACVPCNRFKADRTPEQAKMTFCHKNYKPFKPKNNFLHGDIWIESWKDFISEAYWLTELENDNDS